MSYARDTDAHTRGVGAIAAIDKNRMRQRQAARHAAMLRVSDRQMGRLAKFGGLGMVDTGHLTVHTTRAGGLLEGGSAGGVMSGSGTGGLMTGGGVRGGTLTGGGRPSTTRPIAPAPVVIRPPSIILGGDRIGTVTVAPPVITTPTTPGSTILGGGSTSSGGGGGGGGGGDPYAPASTDDTLTALPDTSEVLPATTTDTSLMGRFNALPTSTKIMAGAAIAGGIYLLWKRSK